MRSERFGKAHVLMRLRKSTLYHACDRSPAVRRGGQFQVMASLIGGCCRLAVRCRAAPLRSAGLGLAIRRHASQLGGQSGSHTWIIAAAVGVAGATTFAVSFLWSLQFGAR